MVDVAVFGVENQFARFELEVAAFVDFGHKRLVKKLQPRDVGWQTSECVPAAEVAGEVHLVVEDFGVDEAEAGRLAFVAFRIILFYVFGAADDHGNLAVTLLLHVALHCLFNLV